MGFLTEVSGPPVTDKLPPGWIFDQIEDWTRRVPDRVAFVLDAPDRSEKYRYSDVLMQSAAVATELESSGIHHGDRVGIVMENTPQWVFVLLGAMQIGAVTVPLATTLPQHSIELIAAHAGCRMIFADDTNWQKAAEVAKNLNCEISQPSSSQKGRHVARIEAPDDGEATAILIYTSGT